AACTMIVAMGCSAWSHAPRAAPVPVETLDFNGPHGFDFEFGEWHVHHRVKAPSGDHAWTQFDGMACDRPLMEGSANVEDNTFFKSSGTTHGVALRTYDARSGQWAIWWIDGRDPHAALDPPVKGSFVGGVGTFYSDGIIDG